MKLLIKMSFFQFKCPHTEFKSMLLTICKLRRRGLSVRSGLGHGLCWSKTAPQKSSKRAVSQERTVHTRYHEETLTTSSDISYICVPIWFVSCMVRVIPVTDLLLVVMNKECCNVLTKAVRKTGWRHSSLINFIWQNFLTDHVLGVAYIIRT